MRLKYMKAVIRQDVGYFDLQSTTTTEVITSVSSDTLVIQDAISEKVPNFLMNLSKFIGGYIFALVMVWRLALVAFPFVLLLVIPGFMYGRALMRLARKNMKEYNQAGSVAEQAIAYVRTVYSFVDERKTMKDFSEALQGTVKLGLKQGLAKGLALGSNGLVFAIWSFMIWYGSRMVMYHGAQGGNVYAVGSLIANGGQALGSAISNLKSLTEACSAGEHIVQVIERVPEIDPYNTKGEILPHISGSVEFKCVEFAYPSRPSTIVFQNLNLEVSTGKILALVGASGSGKSTIVSLLQRFYDPIGGEILLDRVNINKL
ncbi:hypothetical protein F0562_033399 [Nyssa sinensis]|uniref:ABC transmembrane type-1 domain-containing protein n=1 Tax=Nyssa sinensis TaxID=561372 RepID=A0A5J5AS28_9ASTE|nr:hypothetical protein F0562_033399 [Nyssa sinensis]